MRCDQRLRKQRLSGNLFGHFVLNNSGKNMDHIKFVNIYYNNLFDFISDKLRSNNKWRDQTVNLSNYRPVKLASCQAVGFECK